MSILIIIFFEGILKNDVLFFFFFSFIWFCMSIYNLFIGGIIQSPIISHLQLNIHKSDFTSIYNQEKTKTIKLIKKRITKNLNTAPQVGA